MYTIEAHSGADSEPRRTGPNLLAAVDRLHVERVPEHQLDALRTAYVSQPVPARDALAGDNEPHPVRLDRDKKTPGRLRIFL